MQALLPLTILVLTPIGFSLLGLYCGPVALSSNGFGNASWSYFIEPVDPPNAGCPGAPKPVFRDFTSIVAMDGLLSALVAYFSALLDGDAAPQYTLYSLWAFLQFVPLSLLVVLDGMRAGNRGILIGWSVLPGVTTCCSPVNTAKSNINSGPARCSSWPRRSRGSV
jgi:hypothetical protein